MPNKSVQNTKSHISIEHIKYNKKILEAIDRDLYLYGVIEVIHRMLAGLLEFLLGGIIVIYKNNKLKAITGAGEAKHVVEYDLYEKWKELKNNSSDIKAILYFDHSSESVNKFFHKITDKIPKNKLIKLLKDGILKKHIIQNYDLFFTKKKEITQFDWKI